MSDYVKKDEETGLPLYVWESPDRAADPARSQTADPMRYADRFNGLPLLQPIVMGDGGIQLGETFERDALDRPYTAFRCRAFLSFPEGPEGPEGGCAIYDKTYLDENTNARPYNCGSFPLFGTEADEDVVQTGSFIPPTGALPRCTWYGIKIVGPWKDTPYWQKRYEDQANGVEVPPLPSLPAEFAQSLVDRAIALKNKKNLDIIEVDI